MTFVAPTFATLFFALSFAHGLPAHAQSPPRVYSTTNEPVLPKLQSLTRPAVVMTTPLSLGASTPASVPFVKPGKGTPVPLHLGPPLIQTKGLVQGKGALFIADTGKDATHNEPARIWKFDLASKSLSKVYEGVHLVNAKWIFYRDSNRPGLSGELFVSDYGVEPNPRTPGTGEGAKVFVIPLDTAGNPLEPRVLHEGPPLRSPEGITVIGETVVVADWAAGPVTTLGDRQGLFNRGQLFAIPTTGGTPTVLFPAQTFVTLIGVSQFTGQDGLHYLRLIDIDGGRPHQASAFLPQSGLPAFFKARILATSPLVFGRLDRMRMEEEVRIPLAAQGLKTGDTVEVELHDVSRFTDNKTIAKLPIGALSGADSSLIVKSGDDEAAVRATVRIRNGNKLLSQGLLDIPKQVLIARPMDPKDFRMPEDFDGETPRVAVIPDGTSSGVYLSPGDGGLPATLWRGAPLSQPMGAQHARDSRVVYITDQSAGPDGTSAIFSIEMPGPSERLSLFPQLKLPKKPVTVK